MHQNKSTWAETNIHVNLGIKASNPCLALIWTDNSNPIRGYVFYLQFIAMIKDKKG